MATVAFATWERLPGLDPDDRLLVAALQALGVSVRPAVWSDPGVRWDTFDLVLLRSTWDYHRRVGEFLAWIDRVAAQARLLNVATTVRWNADKHYLDDLGRAGVPVVPTAWGSEVPSATAHLRRQGWSRGVMKPAISADGYETYAFDDRDEAATERRFARLKAAGEVMLQPYLAAVDGPGERSLVFFEGEYSHAALRAPKLSPGSALREGARVTPTAVELDVARRALATVHPTPLYARADLVPGPSGPCVLELELIEPTLYLGTHPESAERLASAIVRRLGPA